MHDSPINTTISSSLSRLALALAATCNHTLMPWWGIVKLLMIFPSIVSALPLLSLPNRPCIVPQNSEWTPYSGYRLQYQSAWPIEAIGDEIDRIIQLRIAGSSPQFHLPFGFSLSSSTTAASSEFPSSAPPYSWTKDALIITQCDVGQVVHETTYSFSQFWSSLDLPWNQSICSDPSPRHKLSSFHEIDCYRLARRKLFSQRRLPWYSKRSIVGALYKAVPGSNSCEDDSCREWDPIMPLITDQWSNRWMFLTTKNFEFEIVHRVPLFYTPDLLDPKHPRSKDWAKFVNPYENYDFVSKDPRSVSQRLIDRITGLGHSAALNYLQTPTHDS